MTGKTVAAALLVVLSVAAAPAAPYTLEDALAGAAARNPSLKVRGFEERLAAEKRAQAQTAFYPRMDLGGGFTSLLAPQAFHLGAITQETQDANFPYLSLGIEQSIYDFGLRGSRVRQAELQGQATAERYRGEEKEIFLQVTAAYYRVMEERELVAAAADEVLRMEDHRRTAGALFEQGVVTRNDLLQAEVRVASARARHLSARNRLENAWLRLDYLTGKPPEFRGEPQPPSAILPDACPQADPAAGRPEVAAARKLVASGEEGVREARSGYYPEVFARLGADYLKNDRVREQAIFSGTLGFRMNLFGGGITSSRVREAQLALSRERERLRELEETIGVEYRSACNDLAVAKERIEVARTALRQSEENLRINRERYAEQVGTATEVLDAQTLLTETKTELSRAEYDFQVAAARARKARGEL